MKFSINIVLFLMVGMPVYLRSEIITVIGTGYVGLVAGTCFAELGNTVYCVDIDQHKIHQLQQGIIPIHEEQLPELLQKNCDAQRLFFDTDIISAIKKATLIIIAVGTPPTAQGRADLSALMSVITTIAQNSESYKVICIKSTIPVGTTQKITEILHHAATHCDIVFNPEFLREGTAVHDFLHPTRIVIGVETEKAAAFMKNLYQPLLNKKVPLVITGFTSAEMIKYVANCFLATKIAFINEMSRLSEVFGANIEDIAYGIGLDPRIGKEFLKPGPGFGGFCFPKDLQEFIMAARENAVETPLLDACHLSNEQQKHFIVEKARRLLNNDLNNKQIAILGLAFKAGTDDVRCSPALDIIKTLQKQGATIKAYDPIAMRNAQQVMPTITYCSSLAQAIEGVDLIMILTEWPEFKTLSSHIKKAGTACPILDTRNIITDKTNAYCHTIGIQHTPNKEQRQP